MQSNTLLKERGMSALAKNLGIVDAEKFITLIRRDAIDYTEWQRALYTDVPLDTFLKDAAEFRNQKSQA